MGYRVRVRVRVRVENAAAGRPRATWKRCSYSRATLECRVVTL